MAGLCEQLARAGKDAVEHRLRQLAGESILLARMKRCEQSLA